MTRVATSQLLNQGPRCLSISQSHAAAPAPPRRRNPCHLLWRQTYPQREEDAGKGTAFGWGARRHLARFSLAAPGQGLDAACSGSARAIENQRALPEAPHIGPLPHGQCPRWRKSRMGEGKGARGRASDVRIGPSQRPQARTRGLPFNETLNLARGAGGWDTKNASLPPPPHPARKRRITKPLPLGAVA